MKPASVKQKLKQIGLSFIKNDGGNVFIIVGAAIFMLLAFGGSGVDLARSQIIRHKMHQSADAGALAAGSMVQGVAEDSRTTFGRRYFQLNYPDNYMSSNITSAAANFNYAPDGENPDSVNVTVDSISPTNFIAFLGTDEIAINSETEVAIEGSQALDLDVVLVADTTGSMLEDDKIARLREGALAFADRILNPDNLTVDDKVRMALIGFSAGPTVANSEPIRSQGIKLETDFISDQAIMNAEIGRLDANGRTDGGYAAGAGMRKLLNAPARDDGRTGATKVWIFMTDGIFNMPLPARGRDHSEISDEDFHTYCAAVKGSGAIAYTIRYGGAGNYALLHACASEPKETHFFDAPNPQDIIAVFEKISLDIKGLRITK